MENPLDYDDQQGEIRSQFDQLISAIFSINNNSSEEDIRAFQERVQREVTSHCQAHSSKNRPKQYFTPFGCLCS